MILNPIILEDIEHTQKANESHVRAFDSIIDKVYREDKERKEKAENARKKKEAILHKQEPEKRKAEAAEQRATAEEVPSSNNDIGRGEMESVSTSGVIGSTWAEVSAEQASQYLSINTGVPSNWWLKVAMAESSGNPYALNSIGCYGLYQINQSVHGNFRNASPEQYLKKVIEIYNSQGKGAWEVVSLNGW
ncbi:transglycosylase [Lactococcus phage PLgW-1]|uniref:Lytic transglycosylase n=3 Tax=Uwajimavirus PLgW1 TaxID=2845441 RepID=A0A2Z2P3K7_9CAUD|nr:transglycosylase [Lactococcus phage PLgW-1]ARQ94838.1 lytic transglycosylase [Lactococcus phage PLgW-1]ASJ80010.1 lytic transglycosylase [Lactococcus phage PLgY-16]ASJ80065.1 lytic transglycosylase [Lactococcus phage PLgY-30]